MNKSIIPNGFDLKSVSDLQFVPAKRTPLMHSMTELQLPRFHSYAYAVDYLFLKISKQNKNIFKNRLHVCKYILKCSLHYVYRWDFVFRELEPYWRSLKRFACKFILKSNGTYE